MSMEEQNNGNNGNNGNNELKQLREELTMIRREIDQIKQFMVNMQSRINRADAFQLEHDRVLQEIAYKTEMLSKMVQNISLDGIKE